MSNTKLEMYGLAAREIPTAEDAKNWTYRKNNGEFPPTPLIFPDNPFNNDVHSAKWCLDVGCGVGRNLPAVMNKPGTLANYAGFDPNPSMLSHFWSVNNPTYRDRAYVSTQIDDTIKSHQYDLILTTFVFQHIGYRTPPGAMNVTDISKEVMNLASPGAVWILFEHDEEEKWIERWLAETGIKLDVYQRFYSGFPELNDRGLYHHLMIAKLP